MLYAIGDIHGCLDEWLELQNKIEKKDKDAQYIFVGDIIDRGPKVVETCDWFMENISNFGKYQTVIGNHEHDKILAFNEDITSKIKNNLDTEENISKWWEDEVRYDIDDHYGSIRLFDTYEHYKKFIQFSTTLRYYINIVVNNQRFIIVHANLPYSAIEDDNKTLKPNDALGYKTKDFIVWDRDCIDFDKIDNAILIHGHTPTVFAEAFSSADQFNCEEHFGKIYKTHNRYNIDCGLVYKQFYNQGDLAALCLDTLEEIYLYK